MSIYKNNKPLYSDKTLLQTGENAIYQVFQIKDQWVLRFIKTIIFLIIGGIALPLRLVFRRKIGERSIGFVSAVISIGIFAYLVIGSMVESITLSHWDKWTGNNFDLTLSSHKDTTVYLRNIFDKHDLPKDIYFKDENDVSNQIVFSNMTLNEYNTLVAEKERIVARVNDQENFTIREQKIYKSPTSINSGYTFYTFFRTDPFSLLYIYMSLSLFCISFFFFQNFGLKMPQQKWHSYHRGLGFINLIFSGNQTLIWMIEAVLFLLIGWWFTSFELIQWRLLGTVILIQAFALFIEEYAVHKRKREAILNLIDHEIESRMIAEQRLMLVDADDEKSSRINNEVEIVSIN